MFCFFFLIVYEQKMNCHFIISLCLGFFILMNEKNKTEWCKLKTYYALYSICKCLKFIIWEWNLKFSTLFINKFKFLKLEKERWLAQRQKEEEDARLQRSEAGTKRLPTLPEREAGNPTQRESNHGLCWNDPGSGSWVDQITATRETGQ